MSRDDATRDFATRDEPLPEGFCDALNAHLAGAYTAVADVQSDVWYDRVRQAMAADAMTLDAMGDASLHPTHDSGGHVRPAYHHKTLRPHVRLTTSSYVAALCAILAIALGLPLLRRHASHETSRRYTTTVGQRAIVKLADGSVVTLAPQTALTIAPNFGDQERRISLQGEALFDVAHGARTPFIVHTGRVMTRVVGTQFDMLHYGEDDTVRVAVLNGKVVSSYGTRSLTVVTAAHVGYVTDSIVTVTGPTSLESLTAWTKGPLVFNHTPISEALATLGHWYGVDFRIGDSVIAQQHMSGAFANESREDVLATLESILNVGIQFNERPGHLPVATLMRHRVSRPSHEPRGEHPVLSEVGR